MIVSILLLIGCKPGDAPTFDVGSFEVALTTPIADFADSEDARLEISHADAPDRVIWGTPAGEPFLLAEQLETSVDYGSGSFVIYDEVQDTCSNQILEDAYKDGEDLVLTGVLDDCDTDWTLTLSAPSQARLELRVALGDGADQAGIDQLVLVQSSDGEERIHGFGAQYSKTDMKGEVMPVWSQEQGIGRGLQPLSDLLAGQPGDPAGDWWTTYTAVPFFLTDAPRGFYLDGDAYAVFDMSDRDRISTSARGTSLTAGVIYGAAPADVVSAWTEVTGRMSGLPGWSQTGAIVRAGGGSAAVRAKLETLSAAGVPVAGLWIEDWCGTRETATGTRLWWNWEPDPTLYPDWADLVAELDAEDVHVITYFNPYLADASEKADATRNLYAEALAAGYLVSDRSGAPYLIDEGGFDAAMLDLSNAEAVSWLTGIQSEQAALGVSGWMADFGEALPVDAVLSSREDPWEVHDAWPRLWAELNAESSRGLLVFHRSGDARSPGVAPLFWLGDQTVTWDGYDGLQTVVPALLSAGISGYALEHPDAGLYLSVSALGITRDAELLERSVELAALTSLLRTHDTNEPDENAQIDDDADTLAHFARMATLYADLADYRAVLRDEARETGLPLVRPLYLGWPDQREAWMEDQSFMLGDSFLVAPVVEQGATSRSVWLPPGTWVHLWSGQQVGDPTEADWYTVDAPLGEPPIFYPEGDAWGAALAEAMGVQ